MPAPMVNCLDRGYVTLLDSMGDDLRIVNAAQASLDKFSLLFGTREQAILASLMREEHGVPFEHVVLTFQVKMPLFLAAQFKKHRMSSWSERSARYDEMDNEFYVPGEVRTQVGKAMSYTYEGMSAEDQAWFRGEVRINAATAFAQYQRALDRGVAKEQARILLPPNLYTTVVWTMNLRSLFNLLHLRNDEHAQGEAVEYAKALEALAFRVAPATMALFVESGRPKP